MTIQRWEYARLTYDESQDEIALVGYDKEKKP